MAIVGTLPVQLANGTLADATQVMSDFNYVVTQVNANAAGLLQANNFIGAQTIAGDAIVTVGAAQTITNKTLTSPVITGPLTSGITDLTTTGNTILGSATTNTLNVGSGGLIKDASGNVYVGTTATTGGGSLTIVRANASVDVQIIATVNAVASLAMGFNNSGSVNAYGAPSGAAYVGCSQNFALTFQTGATNRAAIDATGNFIPASNNNYTLGSTAARWSTVYGVAGNFSGAISVGGGLTVTGGATSLTGGDVTGLGIAISRSKPATTNRSFTGATNDPDLVCPLGVGTYAIDCFITLWATGGTSNMANQFNFSGTQTTLTYSATGQISGSAVTGTTSGSGTGYVFGGITTSTGPNSADWARFQGTIVVTVAGSLAFAWAKSSSPGAPSVNVGLGSWLSCTKVA